MIPVGMEPRVTEIYGGFNIWVDPSQGFYWVDGYEPAFWTLVEARSYAASKVPSITEPEVIKSAIPYALVLGIASMLM